MRIWLVASLAMWLAACGGDSGSPENTAGKVCDCVFPGLPEADRNACIMDLVEELEMNMCPDECHECVAGADTCEELDEGCEMECSVCV